MTRRNVENCILKLVLQMQKGCWLCQSQCIYIRLSRSFTARGVTCRDPPKGINMVTLKLRSYYLKFYFYVGFQETSKIAFVLTSFYSCAERNGTGTILKPAQNYPLFSGAAGATKHKMDIQTHPNTNLQPLPPPVIFFCSIFAA